MFGESYFGYLANGQSHGNFVSSLVSLALKFIYKIGSLTADATTYWNEYNHH